MIIEDKFLEMLDLQDMLNSEIDLKWREANYPWHRAAWIECAELTDHIGWKWWKKQEPNLEQAKLELVDIWHFIMSMSMTRYSNIYLSEIFEELYDEHCGEKLLFSREEAISSVENLIIRLLIGTSGKHIATYFFECMRHLNLSFYELHYTYIGKNALNLFRKNNGYKEGTYIKIWDGQEDNEHLTRILLQVEQTDSELSLYDAVYRELSNKYSKVINR